MARKSVKKSLINQLKAKNANIDAFTALVDDYAALNEICTDLKRDIKDRGTLVQEVNCTGREVTKPNPSIKELRDNQKAMLAILKQLGLDTDTVRVNTDDDEL